MKLIKSGIPLILCLSLISLTHSTDAQAEVGYLCVKKEPVVCPAVMPTCIKKQDGTYTTFPLMGEECFDITICYRQEAEDLNNLVDLQASQIAKLQSDLKKAKKAKAKVKSLKRAE